MGASGLNDELIDVVVRLPRKALEDTLLSTPLTGTDRPQRRLGAAKAVLAGRRRRARQFAGVRFCDPSWDMMLELYVAAGEQRHVPVSQLCKLSGASSTTALRHIENLEALGYIGRQADPSDARRLIVLTRSPLLDALEIWLDLQLAEPHLQERRAT